MGSCPLLSSPFAEAVTGPQHLQKAVQLPVQETGVKLPPDEVRVVEDEVGQVGVGGVALDDQLL